MSGGHLRFGEEERLPLYRGSQLWFFLVYLDWHEEVFNCTSSGMQGLLDALPRQPRRAYGIWQGQYNTDVFVCDPEKLKTELDLVKRNKWEALPRCHSEHRYGDAGQYRDLCDKRADHSGKHISHGVEW